MKTSFPVVGPFFPFREVSPNRRDLTASSSSLCRSVPLLSLQGAHVSVSLGMNYGCPRPERGSGDTNTAESRRRPRESAPPCLPFFGSCGEPNVVLPAFKRRERSGILVLFSVSPSQPFFFSFFRLRRRPSRLSGGTTAGVRSCDGLNNALTPVWPDPCLCPLELLYYSPPFVI